MKPHIAVDANGLPHAVWVTTADVTDRDGAVEMLRKCALNLSKVQKVLCDGGYSGENFAVSRENDHRRSGSRGG
ncbi:MAG: transposase [Spirochaetaceae bacterium]|nr:transposase [Spirochaetaceae bacterium]